MKNIRLLLFLLAGTEILSAQGVQGDGLSQPKDAIEVSLVDQKNEPFHISQTQGKIVVLSFIYTHCADICPFASMKIKEVQRLLGTDLDKVVFLAITTDPGRDSPAVIAQYSKEAGLYDTWHFLTGAPEDVEKVWSAYGVSVQMVPENQAEDSEGRSIADMQDDRTKGLDEAEITLAKKIIKNFSGGYGVAHSGPFWIIDAMGKVRAIHDIVTPPSSIVAEIKALF